MSIQLFKIASAFCKMYGATAKLANNNDNSRQQNAVSAKGKLKHFFNASNLPFSGINENCQLKGSSIRNFSDIKCVRIL